MPSYSYKCPKCSAEQVEILAIALELPNPKCPNPKCSSVMNRNYFAPAITFKGTGWGGQSNKKNGTK